MTNIGGKPLSTKNVVQFMLHALLHYKPANIGLFAVDWPKIADTFMPAGQVHRPELPPRLHHVARSNGVLPNGKLDQTSAANSAAAAAAASASNRGESDLIATILARTERSLALARLEKALQQAVANIMTIPVSKIDLNTPVCFVSMLLCFVVSTH